MRQKITLLICLIFLTSFPLVTFAVGGNDDTTNGSGNSASSSAAPNLCDVEDGYNQVGNSNVCEKVFDGVGNKVCTSDGNCTDSCSYGYATHDGESCSVAGGNIGFMGSVTNGDCVCQYTMPGTGGRGSTSYGYEKYDPQDSYINNPDSEAYDPGKHEIDTDVPEINECTDLFGKPSTEGTPAYYIVVAFKVVRYVAIILLIVLSVMDMVGAVASSDSDIINKTIKKIAIRFVLCVIIFLLPMLINFILGFISDAQTNLCGIE